MTNANQPSPPAGSVDQIDPDDTASMAKWSEKLKVTQEQLRAAVAAVGKRASDVELHMKGSRSITNEKRVEDAGQSPIHSEPPPPEDPDLSLIQRT